MDIDDFVPGTAYVRIPESVFSDKQYFKDLLKFLRLPDDCINQYNRNYNYHYLKTDGGILFADEWNRYVKENNYERSE